MRHSEQLDAWAKAFCKLQGELSPVPRASVNPAFDSRYMSADDVIAFLREPCRNNGIAWTMGSSAEEGKDIIAYLTVLHESGQWVQHEMSMPIDRRGGPQGTLSTLTYLKRALLCTAFGIGGEPDDDGNRAQSQYEKGLPPRAQRKRALERQEVRMLPANEVMDLIMKTTDTKFLQEVIWLRHVKDRPEGEERARLKKALADRHKELTEEDAPAS